MDGPAGGREGARARAQEQRGAERAERGAADRWTGLSVRGARGARGAGTGPGARGGGGNSGVE
eukprot:8416951-Pyramimonas_sp.AAC.1